MEVMHAQRLWTICGEKKKEADAEKELKKEERYKQSFELEKDKFQLE